LRKKGLAKAAKKASREANEGVDRQLCAHRCSKRGQPGEVNCETDFVARTDQFPAAGARPGDARRCFSRPIWVSRDEVPADVDRSTRNSTASRWPTAANRQQVVEKIIEGKLDKWYSEICLLEQPFVKNPDVTIEDC
jgi:elongation factor Ts